MERKVTVTLTADEYSTIMATLISSLEVFEDERITNKITEAILAMSIITPANK